MKEATPQKSDKDNVKKGPEPDAKKPIPIVMKEDEPLRSSIKFVDNEKPVPKVIDEPKKSTAKLETANPAETKQAQKIPEPVVETICGRHLKKESDLKSFPVFNDGERGSLLCKYLTEEVWNEYKD